METLTVQIAGLLSVGLVLVLIGLWSARHGVARLLMVGLFTGLMALVFSGSSSLLGRPKPVALEWLQPRAEEATILSGHLIEHRGIYLTLVWGDSEPRLYVMPWDQQAAEQLQQALSEAEQNGTQTMMKRPFEANQDEQQPLFYALPQPKLPDKPVPQQGLRLG